MRDKVKAALDSIRPSLQADGGDVQLLDVNEGVVTVKPHHACGGYPMATMTLQQGIERKLKEKVPQVKKVVGI